MGKIISAGKLEFFVENRAVGEDGGPSIQVLGPIDGKRVQLLRFDMFIKGRATTTTLRARTSAMTLTR